MVVEQVIAFLCTRDVVLLSHTCKHLHSIADDVRGRRQNVQRLLSIFVNDVDGFLRLMRNTGAIIIGESAAAFFTSAVQEEIYSLDLPLYNVNLKSCTESWFSFLKGEMICPTGRFPLCSFVDERLCSCRRYDDYLDMMIWRLIYLIACLCAKQRLPAAI